MSRIGTIARRSFLIGSAAIAGGVVFGWWKYATPYPNPLETGLPEGAATLTPYVLIDQTGVTVIAPRAEMGQGIHSTLAALVAEEMDLAWDQVRVIHGPASNAYYNGAILEEGIPFAATEHRLAGRNPARRDAHPDQVPRLPDHRRLVLDPRRVRQDAPRRRRRPRGAGRRRRQTTRRSTPRRCRPKPAR